MERPPARRPKRTQAPWQLCLTLLCLACAACSVSTPPIVHLQLASGVTEAGSRDAPIIFIEPVEMPDYLLRDELLQRVDAVTLHYNPYQRWAEPLDLAVQRVLGEHLASRLDTRRVVRFPDAPRGEVDWLLRVSLQRFEREAAAVILHATAEWMRAEAPTRTVHSVTLQETRALEPDASGTDTARALSELLARLADALAEAARPAD